MRSSNSNRPFPFAARGLAWLAAWAVAAAVVAPAAAVAAAATPADSYDRSNVPVEQQPNDPAAAKVVLVAGDADATTNPGDHEHFAGCAMLYRMLRQTPGVAPVVVAGGWPRDPAATFGDARAVVFFMNGGGKQSTVAHAADVDRMAAAGVGIVHLHQCVDYPADMVPTAVRWLGGAYHPKTGARGHWDAAYDTLPEHPITRGVTPFKLVNEGYIFKLTFADGMRGVTPLLRARNPKAKAGFYAAEADDVWCFAYDRADGGRSFVNTGGHAHANWAEDGFRRLTVNGILWTAKVEVPAGGAKVDLGPGELMQNMDKKQPRKPATRPATRPAAAAKAAAAAEPVPYRGEAFHQLAGRLVRVTGLAQNSHKGGATLQVDGAEGPLYVQGVKQWPNTHAGKMLSVVGTMARIPDPPPGYAGIVGGHTLCDAEWELAK